LEAVKFFLDEIMMQLQPRLAQADAAQTADPALVVGRFWLAEELRNGALHNNILMRMRWKYRYAKKHPAPAPSSLPSSPSASAATSSSSSAASPILSSSLRRSSRRVVPPTAIPSLLLFHPDELNAPAYPSSPTGGGDDSVLHPLQQPVLAGSVQPLCLSSQTNELQNPPFDLLVVVHWHFDTPHSSFIKLFLSRKSRHTLRRSFSHNFSLFWKNYNIHWNCANVVIQSALSHSVPSISGNGKVLICTLVLSTSYLLY
jgi:hypothetical protein